MLYVSWLVSAILFGALIWQRRSCQSLQKKINQNGKDHLELERRLTLQKRETTQLRARRKRLLAASTEALIVVEKDYRVSSANKVAKQLFGKPHKGISFIKWTRNHELLEIVEQVLQGEKPLPTVVNYGGKALSVQGRFIRDKPTKTIVAVALALHDITELRRLSRARADFISNISHDLRTPVTSIQLLTETLLSGALEDEDVAYELTNKIALQTETLGQLAQEVLDLSLIESGQAPLKLANYPLVEIVEKLLESFAPQIARQQVPVIIDIPTTITVLVDKGMTQRVINNLIHNALKFTKQGSITITAEIFDNKAWPDYPHDEDDWVLVSVLDTGVGVLPDDINRLFERFYTADQSRSNKSTGLGLAIAKHIVNAHGGQIWVESDGKTGSTFYFTVPAEA